MIDEKNLNNQEDKSIGDLLIEKDAKDEAENLKIDESNLVDQRSVEEITKIDDVEVNKYVLIIKDLFKSYGKKEVLKGLNLKVLPGEVFGFIGRNGVGKSTTIDCIVGLKEYDSGDILVMGKDVKKEALETKSLFGYVPSEPTAYEMMTGNEYLQFIGSAYGMLQRSFKANYEFLVKKFQMNSVDMNRRISEYSHGMKQKICLMASLIHNPSIWILDEPVVGLDIMIYEVLVKMIKDFATFGKTVFITSHSIDFVAKVCDRVAIVNNGQVEELIDFNEEPFKRKDLGRIFFKIYDEGKIK